MSYLVFLQKETWGASCHEAWPRSCTAALEPMTAHIFSLLGIRGLFRFK